MLSRIVLHILLIALLLSNCGWFGSDNMDRKEAGDELIRLVNTALDAGIQGKSRPEATPLSFQRCTDDLLGPTDEAMPVFDYEFPYSFLGDDANGFEDRVTSAWEDEGMKITRDDDPEPLHRFAVSEGGFTLGLTVNSGSDQAYIGGSGPCVEAPA